MANEDRNRSLKSRLTTLFVSSVLFALIGCGGGGSSTATFTTGTPSTATTASSATTASTSSTSSTASTGSTSSTTSTASTGTTGTTGEGATSTINFDDLTAVSATAGTAVSADARLSTQYLNTLGVRFSSGLDYVAVVQLPDGDAPSGTNAIAGVSANGTVSYSQANAINLTFFDPTDTTKKGVVKYVSVTADKLGVPSQTMTMQAFDVNGRLLGSVDVQDQGGQTLFLTAEQPVIHRVRILGSTSESGGIAIDDVKFKPVVRAQ